MRRSLLLLFVSFVSFFTFAQVNQDFTVEYACNLSELDSWNDISKFQWKAIDHGLIDNGAEMERLINLVKDEAPKDTTGFYKQFFDARDNQYIVLRMDQGAGKRLFHVRVSSIVSTDDPSHNVTKTYSTRDYIYISPLRGEHQLEIKVWPYGQGEEVAKTYTFNGHSYGSRGARSVMLDRSRLVPGKYDLQYVKMDDETAETDTVTIQDLQPGKLYTFYTYLMNPIVEAWLRFDGFKRMRIDVERWAEDLVTHYDDGNIGVMTGSQMPFLKHQWLEAPNPSYLDTRLFAPHDTLWLNVYYNGRRLIDGSDLVINVSLVNPDGTAKDNVSRPWGQKEDGRFFTVNNGEPCVIEAYVKGYMPKVIRCRGAYNPTTGWVYDEEQEADIYLDNTLMPDNGIYVSKLELTSLTAVDEKRNEYYLAEIQHIDLLNTPVTSVVNYDEYASRKGEKKYVDGTIYDRLASLTATFTAKNSQMPGDRLYLRKDKGAEENKIKVDALEGEAHKLHYPSFDYAYWDADFSLLDYLDPGDSGRPYLAIDDASVYRLPILNNFYFDIDEAKRKAEEEAKKKLEPDKDAAKEGGGFLSDVTSSDLDLSFKLPLAPPPLYVRAGVNFDFNKSKRILIYGAVGLGIDFDFLDKKGATNKWKEGYNGLSKGQMGNFNANKISIKSTDSNGLVKESKWEDITKKFSGDEDNSKNFMAGAGASIEVYQSVCVPFDLKLSDWPGLRFIDEINVNAKAYANLGIKFSVLDIAEKITNKVGGGGAVDWLRNNKYASKVIKALDSGIEIKFNTLLTAKAGVYYYDNGANEINPLKTHLIGASAQGRIDGFARLGLKFDIIAASLEAGLMGCAGVYIKGAAGDRLWFDRPFSGAAWSYRAGFGLYYKVHALFWDKSGEKMWGGEAYKPAKLLGNTSNSNPFHKDYKTYMLKGTSHEARAAASRRATGNSVASQVDFMYPVRFLSGGDSIVYKSSADSPNNRHLRVVSTGNPSIISDYMMGGTADFHSASSANMDLVVFEQATRQLTDAEAAPSDDDLVDCIINNCDVSKVYYAVKKAGDKWYTPKPITDKGRSTGMKPRVAIDDNGHAVAIWQDGYLARNPRLSVSEQNDVCNLLFIGNLVLSRFDGTRWSDPVGLVYLDRRLQLSEYQVTVKDGEVLIAAMEVLPNQVIQPVFIHVTADNQVTVTNAPMEKNNKFELRRVGDHNVLAQLMEVGSDEDSQVRIALNSFDMSGVHDGQVSTSLNPGYDNVEKFHLVVDQKAQSLRNLGLMWIQAQQETNSDNVYNLIKAARLVPSGQNMDIGTPLTMAEISDESRVYDFDGYMTDEKIDGCYLINDESGNAQINRVTSYFSNAFSYSITYDRDENMAITSSAESVTQTNFIVKVNNLGTSTINYCELNVEGLESPIPLHMVVPPGGSSQERVSIPYQSGKAINTTLNVTYDDVLGLQEKQLPRYLARREKRAFARSRGMVYTDEHSNEDDIYEQQTANLYPDIPELECYPVSQTVDEYGNNHFVVRVKNKYPRKMPDSYVIVIQIGDEAESTLYSTETAKGFVFSQLDSSQEKELHKLYSSWNGVGFFNQREGYESGDLIVTIPDVKETKSLYMRAVVRTFSDNMEFIPITGGDKGHEYAVVTVYPSNVTTSVKNVYEEGDSRASLHVKVTGSMVEVSGAQPSEDVRLYFSNGMILGRQKASPDGKATFSMPSVRRGIYLLSNQNETVKFNF